MKSIFILTFYLLRSLTLLISANGAKKLVAENLILRKQLIVSNRNRKKAPNLTMWERLYFACLTTIIGSKRILSLAIVIKPSTLLKLHHYLVKKKYNKLFSNKYKKKPGPKGPSKDVINAVVNMKQYNPRFGCMRIAMQINAAFGLDIDKNVVRRILVKHYKPTSDDNGPSWLTFLGQMKDSLWSIDFFRVESIGLKSHWVMVVMDQFTRKIVGFSTHQGDLTGMVICCMFNGIISKKTLPKRLSSDHDPLFQFHRWQANLRILEIEEIKTIPYTPVSHPFIERLIRTCRNEIFDQTLFWSENDLNRKLQLFQNYFNQNRAHMGINQNIPNYVSSNHSKNVIDIKNYRWKTHCQNIFKLPIAA